MMIEFKRDALEERKGSIEYWWSKGDAGFTVDHNLERRIYVAFEKVLTAMPEEHFDQFMEKDIYLSCDNSRGHAYSFYIPMMKGRKIKTDHIDINVIFLSAMASRWSQKNLENTVAHEIAHHILNHPQTHGAEASIQWEIDADKLSGKWGFKPCYSKEKIKKRAG